MADQGPSTSADPARAALEAQLRTEPNNPALWLALAHAAGASGDAAAQFEAVNKALEAAPNHIDAMLAKADLLAGRGDDRAANVFYQTALRRLAPEQRAMPAAQAAFARAQATQARLMDGLARALSDNPNIAGAQAASPRFDRAVDTLLGRRKLYSQHPRYLHYPELPAISFHDRGRFPWVLGLESAFLDVKAELSSITAMSGQFEPYVGADATRPRSANNPLIGSTDWSAFFLIKDGVRQPGADACPRTMAALAQAPLTQIPGRTPSVLFSKLAAGAHIPPHHGVTNARLICHLPLIVPPDCAFRVGAETRSWREGEAWVFDDTIEHEAWNRSDRDRYILLFDIWHPDLSETEREAVAALCETIDSYAAATGGQRASFD